MSGPRKHRLPGETGFGAVLFETDASAYITEAFCSRHGAEGALRGIGEDRYECDTCGQVYRLMAEVMPPV